MIFLASLLFCLNLELKPQASVIGGQVYLKDLTSVATQQTLKEQGIDRVKVGSAPPAGQSRQINRSFIDGLLSRDGYVIKWSGAESCKLSRKAQAVPGDLLKAEVEDWLANHAPLEGAYSLEEITAPLPSKLPVGSLKFAIYSATKALRPGRNIIRVDTYVDDIKRQSFSATVLLVLEIRAARTLRTLTRGEAITEDDVQWETIKTEQMNAQLITPSQIKSAQARTLILTGTLLDSRKVEKIPMIERNQLVFVSASNGTLKIRMQAKSMDRGGEGETIRLKNLDSGKMFMATVSGMGEAELVL